MESTRKPKSLAYEVVLEQNFQGDSPHVGAAILNGELGICYKIFLIAINSPNNARKWLLPVKWIKSYYAQCLEIVIHHQQIT